MCQRLWIKQMMGGVRTMPWATTMPLWSCGSQRDKWHAWVSLDEMVAPSRMHRSWEPGPYDLRKNRKRFHTIGSFTTVRICNIILFCFPLFLVYLPHEMVWFSQNHNNIWCELMMLQSVDRVYIYKAFKSKTSLAFNNNLSQSHSLYVYYLGQPEPLNWFQLKCNIFIPDSILLKFLQDLLMRPWYFSHMLDQHFCG